MISLGYFYFIETGNIQFFIKFIFFFGTIFGRRISGLEEIVPEMKFFFHCTIRVKPLIFWCYVQKGRLRTRYIRPANYPFFSFIMFFICFFTSYYHANDNNSNFLFPKIADHIFLLSIFYEPLVQKV